MNRYKELNKKGLNISKSKVILSGSDENIFFPEEIKSPLDNRKFKLVTHHWSANWKKGFDIYQIIVGFVGEQF